MTARGIDFLAAWAGENIPPLEGKSNLMIQTLGQKLRNDAKVAGFTIPDLEIKESEVDPFIRETLVHLAEPGTPGD